MINWALLFFSFVGVSSLTLRILIFARIVLGQHWRVSTTSASFPETRFFARAGEIWSASCTRLVFRVRLFRGTIAYYGISTRPPDMYLENVPQIIRLAHSALWSVWSSWHWSQGNAIKQLETYFNSMYRPIMMRYYLGRNKGILASASTSCNVCRHRFQAALCPWQCLHWRALFSLPFVLQSLGHLVWLQWLLGSW